MYSKWFDEYHKLHPEIQINYQSIGSGGGIRQITEGTVDFGASDGPMNDDQLKAYKEKRGMEVLALPDGAWGRRPDLQPPRGHDGAEIYAGSACRHFSGKDHKVERSGAG